SERRNYFSESDSVIREKLVLLFENEITPIVCVGETLEQRAAGETEKIITDQLEGVFRNIDLKKKIVLAYEPVWAIGTGKTATPDQAQEIHLLIRNWLSKRYSDEIAEKTSILYGGSVTPENINDLTSQADIDGGLIGGASLVIEKFINIIDLVLEQKK
ncbi:MAG: triosephosphate isomerase, partial [Candidatus Cloacimonetes bacterium]|nr:triosephosphate isomerase [Candidatus Cloacimonadota bacterium]